MFYHFLREFLDIQYIFILSVVVALLLAGRNNISFFVYANIQENDNKLNLES